MYLYSGSIDRRWVLWILLFAKRRRKRWMIDSTSVGMRWRRQREFSTNRGIRRFFGGRVQQRMISWTLCLLHLYQVALGGIG